MSTLALKGLTDFRFEPAKLDLGRVFETSWLDSAPEETSTALALYQPMMPRKSVFQELRETLENIQVRTQALEDSFHITSPARSAPEEVMFVKGASGKYHRVDDAVEVEEQARKKQSSRGNAVVGATAVALFALD